MVDEELVQGYIFQGLRFDAPGCTDIFKCQCDFDKKDCLELQCEQLYAELFGWA